MGANCCAEPIERALRSHVLNLSESPLETWDDVIAALAPFQGVPIVGTTTPSIAAKRREEDDTRKRILKEGGMKAIGDFTGFILSSLVLTSCKKGGTKIPRSFAEHDCFLNLRHLQLSNCKLTNISAFAFLPPDIPATEIIAMETEKMYKVFQAFAASGKFSKALKGFRTYPLETLNVSHNELNILPPGLFCRFPKLAKLVASHNGIVAPPSACYDHIWLGANNLTHLYLGANNINSVDFLFGDCATPNCLPKLHEVDLLGNRIRGVCPLVSGKEMKPLAELRVLDLQQQGDALGTLQRKRDQEEAKVLKKRALSDLNSDERATHRELQLRYSGQSPLRSVDPSIYTLCPDLHHLRLEGNAYEAEIRTALSATPEYKAWRERRAEVATKQIRGGADVFLV